MTIKSSICAIPILLTLPLAGNAAIIQNGSFENPLNTWTNTFANYMAVPNGSQAITGWAITNATGRGVAWAQSPTSDGYFPSTGSYFVDLSGFGIEAGPNAKLTQVLQNLIAGVSYTLGIDYWGDQVTLTMGGTTIAAPGSAPNGWAHLTTVFQAGSAQESLSIGYVGTSGVAFVDNLTIAGPEARGGGSTVPEPGALVLAATALAILAGTRRRPARGHA